MGFVAIQSVRGLSLRGKCHKYRLDNETEGLLQRLLHQDGLLCSRSDGPNLVLFPHFRAFV